MEKPPKPTTPEEEGVELHPDAWERFESALKRAEAGGPIRGVPSASAQVSSVTAGIGVNGSTQSAGLGGGGGAGGGGGGGAATIQQVGQVTPQLDPFLQNTTTFGHLSQPQANTVVSQTNALIQSAHNYNTVLNQGLLTGGSLQYRTSEQYLKENSPSDYLNPVTGPRMDFIVRQPVLQGYGIKLNNRGIRIAQVNTTASGEVFRSRLLDLVASVLNLYWGMVSANDELRARQHALEFTQKFYEDTQKEIAAGAFPRVELPRAQAELTRRRQDVVIARQNAGLQAISMKAVLSRTEDPALEAAEIIPLDQIQVPDADDLPPLRQLVTTAMAKRPDVAVSKFRDQTAEMSLIGTTNPLLPNLTGSVQTYNKGVAGTPQVTNGQGLNPYFVGGYGTALAQVFRRNFPNNIATVTFSAPLENRQAQGDYGIDQLQFVQSQLSSQKDTNAIIVDISARLSALTRPAATFAIGTMAAFWFVERLSNREPGAHTTVQGTPVQELFVAALRRNAAAIEHQNGVGVANRGQAMRDDDRRSSGPQLPKGIEDDLFGNGVER
jgi:hypothetical protein